MPNIKTNSLRNGEKGNVLFLILIAVALFAALSYAVTQSSRSGGGNASNETNLVDSATVTQYPASVRTAIIRQEVNKNIESKDLEFNAPSDFAGCTVAASGNPEACVFHPLGGGGSYELAAASAVTTGTTQAWVINGENEVNLVGTTGGANAPTATSADIVAFLPNVKDAVCKKINAQLGIDAGAIPPETSIDVTTKMGHGSGYTVGFGHGGGTIGEGTAASLDGQSFGCFSQGGANYYFHVLIEQ